MDTPMPIQMNPIIPFAGRLASVIVLVTCALTAQVSTLSTNPGEEVLKRAFYTEHDSQVQVPLSVAVAYLPSCHPESKVVIRFRSATQADVEYIQAKINSREAVQKLRTASGVDIGAAVALMGTKRMRKSIDPDMAMAWLNGLRAACARPASPMRAKYSRSPCFGSFTGSNRTGSGCGY